MRRHTHTIFLLAVWSGRLLLPLDRAGVRHGPGCLGLVLYTGRGAWMTVVAPGAAAECDLSRRSAMPLRVAGLEREPVRAGDGPEGADVRMVASPRSTL